jgi:S-adenosylmethionine hydrolase
MNRPCISLLTDFGLQDSYVGQMKGAIAAMNPDAIVVDLTHAIPPQQVWQAAVTLSDSIDAFPPGTIHLAVVDPGVGSTRRAIAAEIGSYRFVCPDNGLLSLVLQRQPLRRAVHLDRPRWWRPTVSGTFHGRDLFAPVAAAWSLGHDLAEFGSPLQEPLTELSFPNYSMSHGVAREIRGQVLSIDHFGNLVTNIPRSAIPTDAAEIIIQIADIELSGLARCYAERCDGECVALFGSSDRLEIAVTNGNAAQRLSAGIGTPVYIQSS